MALSIATIADSISNLSVSGLTIKDMDTIPASASGLGSLLIPLPNFVTDFNMSRDSYGGGSTAKMTVTYNLNYRLLFAPAGSGRDLEYFDNMVSMVGLLWDAVMAIELITGAVDLIPAGLSNMGLVNDPAEQNEYYGCDVAFMVTEFVN